MLGCLQHRYNKTLRTQTFVPICSSFAALRWHEARVLSQYQWCIWCIFIFCTRYSFGPEIRPPSTTNNRVAPLAIRLNRGQNGGNDSSLGTCWQVWPFEAIPIRATTPRGGERHSLSHHERSRRRIPTVGATERNLRMSPLLLQWQDRSTSSCYRAEQFSPLAASQEEACHINHRNRIRLVHHKMCEYNNKRQIFEDLSTQSKYINERAH